MKQNFTILWIEDKERVIDSQIPEIKSFLDNEGFELNLLKDTVGDKFRTLLKNDQLIDIIITDYNISEETKGTDVIKYVRNNGFLTDILFYSVHDYLFEDEAIYSELGHYGLIEICEDKEVTEPLKQLIKKNLMRCKDIVFLRGFIISQSIELELKLNDFFSTYFEVPKKQLTNFHNIILESRYIPMAGKKKWLSQILKKTDLLDEFKGLLTNLDDISEKRNLLAHCKKDSNNPNILVSSGKDEKIDRDELNRVIKKIDLVSGHIDRLIEKLPIETGPTEDA